jgi:hypothetical protein
MGYYKARAPAAYGGCVWVYDTHGQLWCMWWCVPGCVVVHGAVCACAVWNSVRVRVRVSCVRQCQCGVCVCECIAQGTRFIFICLVCFACINKQIINHQSTGGHRSARCPTERSVKRRAATREKRGGRLLLRHIARQEGIVSVVRCSQPGFARRRTHARQMPIATDESSGVRRAGFGGSLGQWWRQQSAPRLTRLSLVLESGC